MNYLKIYDRLMEKALVNGLPETLYSSAPGVEIHHKIPCLFFSFGRKDRNAHQPENLRYLSSKAHLLAHHLLAKIYPSVMGEEYYQMCLGSFHGRKYRIPAHQERAALRMFMRASEDKISAWNIKEAFRRGLTYDAQPTPEQGLRMLEQAVISKNISTGKVIYYPSVMIDGLSFNDVALCVVGKQLSYNNCYWRLATEKEAVKYGKKASVWIR